MSPGFPRSILSRLGALLAVLAALAWLQLQPLTPAVRLTLTDLDGRRLEIPPAEGLVLLNFWATTCPACIAEIPLAVRLHRRFGPRGLRVIGVAMPYDRPDRVLRFARDYPLPYPVALDPRGDAADGLGVRLTPTWILVDPRGRIVWRHTGYVDEAALVRLLETRLKT